MLRDGELICELRDCKLVCKLRDWELVCKFRAGHSGIRSRLPRLRYALKGEAAERTKGVHGGVNFCGYRYGNVGAQFI